MRGHDESKGGLARSNAEGTATGSDVVDTGSRRVLVVLVCWVAGCLVVAGAAFAAFSGDDDEPEPQAAAQVDGGEPAAASEDVEAAVDAETEPAPGNEEPETTSPPSAPGEDGVSEEPLPATPDDDPVGVDEPVRLEADRDADGDGILDDWEPPDAGIGTYRPGDEALDGEFEEDRRIANGCEPAYEDICIPPAPPVLSCAEAGVSDVLITSGGDPHFFDTDYDGIGCESMGEGEEEVPAELDPPSPIRD